ncbi:hypothetical protein C7212DRAFT_347337 [Tuber magnatum]|uniref:Uncharacterized protein n=1 Tax=Tuber magnatum TaxID=42249 RepID=A0A317SGZ5_9PEZI|nr:hypothetical protein C7212DRAFT_347337 [Tuber magnatum]
MNLASTITRIPWLTRQTDGFRNEGPGGPDLPESNPGPAAIAKVHPSEGEPRALPPDLLSCSSLYGFQDLADVEMRTTQGPSNTRSLGPAQLNDWTVRDATGRSSTPRRALRADVRIQGLAEAKDGKDPGNPLEAG